VEFFEERSEFKKLHARRKAIVSELRSFSSRRAAEGDAGGT